MAKNKTKMYVLGLIALAAVAYGAYSSGVLGQFPGQVTGGGAVPTTIPATGMNYGTTVSLSVSALGMYNGTLARVNAELWDGVSQVVAATDVNSALTSLSTNLPNIFTGYLMLGNDDYVSATDLGREVYYTKYPVSWNQQGLLTKPNIPVYEEETAAGSSAISFYDNNVVETTANISITAGGTYSDGQIKIKATSDLCIGNPEFNGNKPLMICFNETDSGDFKEIKLTNNLGRADSVPGFLSGYNVVDCWYADSNAICDGSNPFTSDIYYELNAGESVTTAGTDASFMMVLDKTYYLDDYQKWAVGYGDESNLGSDSDVGIDSMRLAIPVYLTGI